MTTSNLSCTICSECYNTNDEILCTSCGHVFHSACFRDWESRSSTCPECRKDAPGTQRIFLHLEETTEVERKVELINKISLLERQLDESEQNFFDIQQALTLSNDEVTEFKTQLEFIKVQNESFEQELTRVKQTLNESEQNFMSTLEQLKKSENELIYCHTEIDFLRIQNENREKKLTDIVKQYEESKDENKNIHILLENKLKIKEDEVMKLSQDMDNLQIEKQRIDTNLSMNKWEIEHMSEERIKRLEEKLKQMSLELDKEIKHSTSLTVENMKLKNIISLPLKTDEEKHKVAIECEEQRNKIDCRENISISNDLIDF